MPDSATPAPLILTLRLDEVSREDFERLRREHFPPERNMIPAHLSLFNRLPGDRLQRIHADAEEVCARYEPMTLSVTGLRFLGRGVSYVLESPRLEEARRELAEAWEPWLSRQDRQGFKAHVTIQNKVAPECARELYEQLRATFTPFEARGEGLLLWRYLGGPWEMVSELPFGR